MEHAARAASLCHPGVLARGCYIRECDLRLSQLHTTCLFDEIDAALDVQKTQALARHMAASRGVQCIFVSHRTQLIEAAERLVGTYTFRGGSRSVSISPSAH